MRAVICGAGIIGACTAYYLSRRGVEVVVVEREAVACAASGKAGGFLALDWSRGTALDALSRRSFALHGRLADDVEGDWGYRRVDTFGGYLQDGAPAPRSQLRWVSDGVVITERLGSPETTAIVTPGAFTRAMMRAAIAHGTSLRRGRVTGLRVRGETTVEGVIIDAELVAADAVVIAMGPWSVLAAQWLPLPAIFAYKGHSLIFATGDDIPAHALFLQYEEESGPLLTPEVFARADGTTYVSALSTQSPLALDPAAVTPDPGAVERLQQACKRISPALSPERIIARQACHRPIAHDGLPLIGPIPGVSGAYVASGHSVWGILNAPATGEAMAELVLDGAAHSVELAPFDPGRLRPLDPARVHGAFA
jgi:glycine/D-amino acid oxidase-like deaminating enzyme